MHACKTNRLVILLLLCVIPAAAQYSRHASTDAEARTARPQRFVYDLRGDIERPGIYRYAAPQTEAALALACGAAKGGQYRTELPVKAGTCVTYSRGGTACTSMDAAALISFSLPLSLATATAEELEMLPGIGPKTARALIDYRNRSGPVRSIEQLVEVRGIGLKTLKKIAPYIRP